VILTRGSRHPTSYTRLTSRLTTSEHNQIRDRMEKLGFDEEGLSAIERGRQRYQGKDFAGAIDAFTEVGLVFCAVHSPLRIDDNK
jgi:hypothetical protein